MADLLWPGDHRAGVIFSDEAVLAAMVEVEQAWLDGLVAGGVVGEGADLTGLVGSADLPSLAEGAEAGGNPVIGLVGWLRSRSGCPSVHRGLTSQDVVDTALVLCLRSAVDAVRADVARQARALAGLAVTHRGSVMAGRTLTQHAVPVTFGLKAAGWLAGLAAAVERLDALPPLPVQVGGAAGTLAAVVELGGSTDLVADVATRLGLAPATPWHTERSALTSYADVLVGLADVWGRVAGDVALLSRPEIGELREGSGGGSSTMPGKANPVLSTLLRRHALAAPGLAATLHVAAASYVDERPDGAWHAEWDTLRLLARRSVVAAAQAADLLEGLVVDAGRMAARAAEAAGTLTAEQVSMGGDGGDPSAYLGATDPFIDAALDRAGRLWKDLT